MIWGCAQVVDGLFMRLLSRSLARRWLRYRLRYRRCYEWQLMTPARRAFHECRMQFPRHRVAPRIHIVGIATFADAVESSPNRIACETAPSARAACVPPRTRGPAHSRVGPLLRARTPLIRTWVRYLARGPAIAGAGPLIRAWFRWYARGRRRPRASLGVGVRVMGLTRMFSGSRASDIPGQAPLRPQRRPPCPQHPVVGVCYRGGLRLGRHAAPRRDLADSKLWELRYTGTRA